MTTLGPFSDVWKQARSRQCCSWGQVTATVTSLRATRAQAHTSARSPKRHEPVGPPLRGRRSRGGLDPGSRGTTWKHHPHPGQALPGIRRTLRAEDEGRAPAPARPAPATTAPSGSCRPRRHRDAPSHLRDAPSSSNVGLAAPTPALQLAASSLQISICLQRRTRVQHPGRQSLPAPAEHTQPHGSITLGLPEPPLAPSPAGSVPQPSPCPARTLWSLTQLLLRRSMSGGRARSGPPRGGEP